MGKVLTDRQRYTRILPNIELIPEDRLDRMLAEILCERDARHNGHGEGWRIKFSFDGWLPTAIQVRDIRPLISEVLEERMRKVPYHLSADQFRDEGQVE